MERARFLQTIRDALGTICEPHFFDTERGYQGALVSALSARLAKHPIWPGTPVVEQEYQKRAEGHGITIRPDIIVHIPFDRGAFSNRRHGNYAVIQLKRRGGLKESLNDFCKLTLMCSILDYAVGVFINIDANVTYFNDYEGEARSKLYAFAVLLQDGRVVIREDGIV